MLAIINSAYLLSAAIAGLASLNSRSRSSAGWWLVLSVGLIVLGALRIEQASVWTDDYLRDRLFVMGWYDHRRPVQVICVALFAISFFALLRWVRYERPALTFAMSAFYALVFFAAIRSSSLHWTDAILSDAVGPLTVSHVAQIVLLLATSAAAFFDFFSDRKRKHSAVS